MHRKNRVPRVLLGSMLLFLLCAADGDSVSAQPAEGDKQPAQPSQQAPLGQSVTVPINGTTKVSMQKRKDKEGKEYYPLIGQVNIERTGVINASQVMNDQRYVILRGVAPGLTKLELTAVDEVQPEVVEVIVQQDIELLRNILTRSVPTASVIPIPGAGNTIILTGWVARAEDVETIMRIARTFTAGGAGGADIVNAMRVGGVMQVQLDVVVARVARSEFRRMACDLYNIGAQHQYINGTGGAIALTGLTVQGGVNNLTTGLGTPNGAAANQFLAIFTNSQNIFFFLQALRDNNLAKLLSEPRLVTLSGHAARINSGGEQAVPQVSGLGGTAGVQFVPFGTTLSFLPIVLGNGKIYLEVEPEVSALDNAAGVVLNGSIVPGRVLQRLRTAVEIEPGQTLAIGGLIQNTVQASSTKLPILGDLPFIGTAFSRKSFNEVEEELVVLVTPHLVDPMDCHQLPKFLPGQETRRPDDVELYLEGILEAPRGSRELCPEKHYVPAFKHSPTMGKYPCGDLTGGGCGGKGCGAGCTTGCGAQGCTSGCATPTTAVTMEPGALPGSMVAGQAGSQEIIPVSSPVMVMPATDANVAAPTMAPLAK